MNIMNEAVSQVFFFTCAETEGWILSHFHYRSSSLAVSTNKRSIALKKIYTKLQTNYRLEQKKNPPSAAVCYVPAGCGIVDIKHQN